MAGSRISAGKLVAAAIVAAWLGLVGYYAWTNYVGRHAGPPAGELPSEALADEWFKVAWRGQRAGWIHNSYETTPGGYVVHSESLINIMAMGVEQKARINLDAEVDERFRLKGFGLSFKSDAQNLFIDGRVEGDAMTYEIRSSENEKPVRRTMTLREPPLLMDLVGRYAAAKGLEVGQKFEVPVFDPLTRRADRTRAEVMSAETIDVGYGEEKVFKVRVDYMGMEMYSWLDELGRVVKSDTPMGVSAVRSTRKDALELEGAGKIDVIAASAVTADTVIVHPRNVSYMKARIGGVDRLDETALDGGHQKLEGNVVVIEKAEIGAGYTLPDDHPDLEEYRSSDALIQSDSPRIVKAAREAAAGATGSVQAARNINKWVYANMEKVPTLTVPSALEVLESKRGDCNEHAQLYVALARAIGLPARTAAGVVYLEGAFYYHAWPEVYLGGESGWVPVDPTFGQFPADATHVRLVTGSLKDQAEISRFLGRLEIKILGYE